MNVHIDLDDDATWVAALRQVRAQIAELKQTEAVIEGQLKGRLGEATEARVGGRPVITYRWTKPVERLDTRRLRREHPDLIAEYTRTGEPGRRFVLLDVEDGGA
ncbi:hypothetical protein CDO52_00055 [Nocardiopsis gilva YIM 90087]|uniref:Uncharacterized protein n=1 Tax=Nocardiopsis gilva YIM 90087 TaxID=1235441 RepID=A0A223RZS5_9ACTN|nr:hypothetical protein [Nocardiopsis gilva]ASU81385.1 hypothetical protein CDO52_00055 [Nocardiopsis gilva YIM 90087]